MWGEPRLETCVEKSYALRIRSISKQPRTMAPKAMPSITTKMSLRGVWTKMPGRLAEEPRPPTARVAPVPVPVALAARPERRRDKVALLYLLALDGRADH